MRLLVRLTPEPATRAKRVPLNIALVLDRSASMHGEKLRCVKEAARELIGSLADEDTVSLTAYHDEVEALVAPQKVGEGRQMLGSAIAGIEAGGTTALCAGFTQGGDLAATAIAEDRLSRILLLTDGLANVGITDPDRIAVVVDQFMGQGIGTSTIGVGEAYNEALLARMAERGGGSTYFLRSPAEAAEVFAEELRDLSSIDVRDIRVRFVPATDGLAVEQLNTYVTTERWQWRVGDLFGAAPRCLVVEIRVPPLEGQAGTAVALGSVEISFSRPTGDGFERCSSSIPVSLALATRAEIDRTRADREVTLEAAYLIAARVTAEAMHLADAGEFDKADELLVSCVRRLDTQGLADDQLNTQLERMRERARRLREERAGFYGPLARKEMCTESEYGTKGLFVKSTLMHERAARYAPRGDYRPGGASAAPTAVVTAERAVYPCYLVNGHILTEIGDGRLLVDTGATASMSDGESIELLGHVHRTTTSYMGTTISDIEHLVGTRITALLGADLLGNYDVRIDLDKGELELSEAVLALPPPVIRVEDFQGVPIVPVGVDGRDERFFFDTAAKLSYLDATLAAGWTPIGSDTDFFPGFGEFTAETGTKQIEVAGRALVVRFATLPPLLEASLGLAGVRGILGSALSEESVVTLSLRRRSVSFG
ncbi:MAG: VWA domain-containing protein [Spirochaetaceae bacterium]|nr:MAG: VWA domain-containing protein [Spirochaetaceae bacterium]